jgi:hypothetical protein
MSVMYEDDYTDMTNTTNRPHVLRNESGNCETFRILEVVEELVAEAYERGSKRITMSRIGKELKHSGRHSVQNTQAVYEALVDLGYQVGK